MVLVFPSRSSSGRIAGGVDAEDGVAPFQCSLQIDKSHHCGCAIISTQWIVTAQDCVRLYDKSFSFSYFSRCITHINHILNRFEPKDLEVYAGSNDLKGNGTYYKLEEIIIHEKYDEPKFAYDIAVIRVQGSIALNDKVQPIELSPEEVPDGAITQLTGWGRLSVCFVSKLLRISYFSNEMYSCSDFFQT